MNCVVESVAETHRMELFQVAVISLFIPSGIYSRTKRKKKKLTKQEQQKNTQPNPKPPEQQNKLTNKQKTSCTVFHYHIGNWQIGFIEDFLGGLVVKNPPCNAGNMDSIPGQGSEILNVAHRN